MKIVKTPLEMKNLSRTYGRSGKSLSFVPTMGALHDGHLSLLSLAREQADISVMSVFVNPTQFGPHEDFQKYPRPFEEDCEKAQAAGCDILFAPSAESMYPRGYCTYVNVEKITDHLCGAVRPGHFRGVATVVLKLLNIVSPQVAVFGQKDAQQVIVIKRMVSDLDLQVRIEVGPTFRERDGLAMSSRNKYLTAAERAEVPLLFRGLVAAGQLFNDGERRSEAIKETLRKIYAPAKLFSLEYIEIADIISLLPSQSIAAPVLVAVACRTRESATRLIDNIVLGGQL